MHIGERIKSRREELGMTQDELAKKVGYKSRSSINKIELSRDLPLKKVDLMASALHCVPGYLMGWTDIPEGINLEEYGIELPPDDSEDYAEALKLYELYRKASPEIQAAVEILLKKATPGS